MAVVLADLLQEEHVVLELAARTREAALREIIWSFAEETVGNREKFLAEVVAREEVHTTFMGNGVAFPHARTDLVPQILLGIGRSGAGIPFGENGELAHLLFVIGVPRRMVNDYLVCVGALARLTKVGGNREQLMNAQTATEIVEILRAGSLLLE